MGLFSIAPSAHLYAQKKDKKNKQEEAGISEKDRMKADKAFFDGLKELSINNPEEAIKHFEACVKINPENDAAYYEMSKLYGQLGNLSRSKEYGLKANSIEPTNIYYLDLLAGIELSVGNTKEAVKVYEEIIALEPTDPVAYMAMAQLYEANGNDKKAEEYYSLAETKSGAEFEVLGQRIDHYMATGSFKKALNIANRLVEMMPSDADLLLMRADIYARLNMRDKAKEELVLILEKAPEHGQASFALAQLYFQEGNIDECLRLMANTMGDPSLEADPKMEVLIQILSDPGSIKFNKELIYDLCERALVVHPGDPRVYSVYGDFLNRDGKIEQALTNFQKAVELAPDKYLIWEQIVLIQLELGKFQEMEQSCKKAISLFPSNADFYLFNSYAKEELNKAEERIETLQEGIQYVIGSATDKANFYSALGDAYHDIKDFPKSDEYYEKAIELAPENTLVLNNFAYNLSLRGKSLEKARTHSYKSLELEPNNAIFQDTYGWILFKMERYEEALEYLLKAANQLANEGEVLEHCGDTYFKLGNTKFALDYWKKAKEVGNASQDIDFKIKELRLK